MIVTVTSYKGGVGKTTTAVHLATWLSMQAPTLLVDSDAIRSATHWSQRGDGKGLPFRVVSTAAMARESRNYEHIVIDTEGNPSADDFRELAGGCDVLIIPAVPESVATDGLTHTLDRLHALQCDRYRVLLTMVPPRPRNDGEQLRAMLIANEIPTFAADVPRLAAFEKAAAEGVPVRAVKDERAMRGWNAYQSAGEEMWELWQNSQR